MNGLPWPDSASRASSASTRSSEDAGTPPPDRASSRSRRTARSARARGRRRSAAAARAANRHTCDGAWPGRLVRRSRCRDRSRISTPPTSSRSGSISRATPDGMSLIRSTNASIVGLGHAALAPDLDPPRERGAAASPPSSSRGGSGRRCIHNSHRARSADRRRLAPVIGMWRACRRAAARARSRRFDLVHRPLELGQRVRLVHARVDQHDPVAGRDRPRVAVRDLPATAAAAAAATGRAGPVRLAELTLTRHDDETIFAPH